MLRLMCVGTDRDDLPAEFMIALNDVLCRVRMTESVFETAGVDLNPLPLIIRAFKISSMMSAYF